MLKSPASTLVAYLISFSMAFLLFVVQPMATKVILPQFGGTPGVWNTAMLCFQVLLLLGYVYAHVLSTYLKPRIQIMFHGALVVLACIALPIAFPMPSAEAISHEPIRSLIGQLLLGVGVPFFCVSATAPLLQRWVSYSDIALSSKPYVLYSASNLGSMSALIGYILLIEPNLAVSLQMAGWGYVFVAISLLLLGFAYRINGGGATQGVQHAMVSKIAPLKPSLFWVLLAFVPSSLSLGLTTHITTDIASVPFFWVIPFAIYLLSFVDAFATRPRIVPFAKRAAPLLLLLCLLVMVTGFLVKHTEIMFLHLAAFALAAFAIHGHLADRKPELAQLTWYYVCLSIGGALGGMFNAILAPMLLNDVLEYTFMVFVAAVLSYCLGYMRARLLFVTACMILFGFALSTRSSSDTLLQERNFYGVSRVFARNDVHYLQHNTTIHGLQSQKPDSAGLATSYYAGLQEIMLNRLPTTKQEPVGAVGLGVGTVKCQLRDGERMDIFEINPLVVDIAENVDLFTYLSGCKGDHKIVLGDGRLTMADMPHEAYGTIVIDAFSSDAIPVHLLTKEAFEMYLDKLKPGGLIAIHVTNRHLDLRPLIAKQAEAVGAVAYTRFFEGDGNIVYSSFWVVVARNDATLAPLLTATNGWWKPDVDSATKVWTDDYTNILPYLKRMR